MLQVIRSKMHGIAVTGSELDYHGSVTLDPEQCTLAGIKPLEFVDLFNKNNGERFYTYVIFGVAGSRCCILNGASARKCQVGDPIIICASTFIEEGELYNLRPNVVSFGPGNEIRDVLHYEVFESPLRKYEFRTVFDSSNVGMRDADLLVDGNRLRQDLQNLGIDDAAIANILLRHSHTCHDNHPKSTAD